MGYVQREPLFVIRIGDFVWEGLFADCAKKCLIRLSCTLFQASERTTSPPPKASAHVPLHASRAHCITPTRLFAR